MGTRSVADIAPTPATMALNAYIYGYGGHSLVTPHAQLKQMWWTAKKIDAEVTRSYVVRNLRLEERDFLNKPLAFGEGLTDDTYMDWILERAKRLFRILAEVGLSDQIFGCIDDSWDDDDLPIPLEIVEHLHLTDEYDAALNRRFYNTQFRFLLRELKEGSHIDYGPSEHIPMEHVNTVPPAVSLQVWDRVHFPGRPDEIFMRRKYSLVDRDSGDHKETFLRDVRKAKSHPHEHIASIWASYTSENKGYIISDFVGEHTLGTFIDHRTPQQFTRVPASERPILVCEWMHCLADALASLHHSGFAHTAIRPSNILIDHDNRIAFADVGSIRTLQRGKKTSKTEIYNYAAPESQLSEPPPSMASSPPISSVGAFSRFRKMSSSTSGSSASSNNGSLRNNSFCTPATSSTSPSPKERSDSLTESSLAACPPAKLPHGFRNFSRHIVRDSRQSFWSTTTSEVPPLSPTGTEIRILPKPTIPDPSTLQDLPQISPEMTDIFALACVFLDILTFVVKGKINDFVKFRTTKISSPLQKGRRTRTDQSFHADPDKVDAWIEVLREDCEKRSEKVFSGVPGLLKLVKKMMMQNATLRPTALDVRDQIRDILENECVAATLCCADRAWETAPVPDETPHIPRTEGRDSLSVVTGMYDNALPPRNGSESARGGASRCEDRSTPLSRTESETSGSVKNRRRSSASMATVKLGSWRRAFSSSSKA